MSLLTLLNYSIEEPEEFELGKPYYTLQRDGVYRSMNVGVSIIREKYIDFRDVQVPGLREGEEGIEYNLPKVPFKYWLMILDFYKEVNDRDGTEASVHIFYHEGNLEIPEEYEEYTVGLLREGNWIVYCPQQENSSTLTSFGDDELYEWFRRNTIKVIETHSHNTMDAFWSGTDDKNQQDVMYYGVYGLLGTEDKFLMKFVKDGEVIDVPVEEVFEYPMVKIEKSLEYFDNYEDVCKENVGEIEYEPYTGVFGRRDEYPLEWLTECHSVKNVVKKERKIRKGYEQFKRDIK